MRRFAPYLALSSLLTATGCSDCSRSEPAATPTAKSGAAALAAASTHQPAAAPPQLGPQWTNLDPPAEPNALGASLTATSGGVLATWVEPWDGGPRVRIATLVGDRWGAATTVVSGPKLVASWADFPRSAMSDDGALYVHYPRHAGEAAHAREIQLMRSQDGGASFQPLGVVNQDATATEHGFVSMVPDGNGVRLFWLDGRATVKPDGATALFTARATTTIGPAKRLDDRVCDCCQTDAALTNSGPLVVFRDRSAEDIRDVSVVRWRGGEFAASAPVHADGWKITGCPVNGPAAAASGSRSAVAWYTGADGGSVRVAFSTDGVAFSKPTLVDPGQPPGRVDLAMLDDGAAVSWVGRAPGNGGQVRMRFVAADGKLGASVVVADTDAARSSGFPVLVRDGSRLLIAYRDGSDPPRIHVASLPTAQLPRSAGSAAPPPESPRINLGDPLPAVQVRAADGEPAQLASLAPEGKPLVVAFFASWCMPCRDELRVLESLRGSFPSAQIIAVSVDEGSAAAAEATARGWGFSGRVLRDDTAAAAFGVPPLPGLFVFDAARKLRLSSAGQVVDEAALKKALE